MKKEHATLLNILIGIYEKYVLRTVINKTDYLVCTSDYVRNVFLKEFLSKSVTITPGVDMDTYRPAHNNSKSEPSILYVGRVDKTSRWKGILIDSMNSVIKSVPAATLSIVGDGDDLTHYKKYVEKLGLRQHVYFYGKLTGTDLVSRYQKSDVLVLPSTTDTEGFGMVLIEAMACKKPVIGSRVGGIPSVIKHGKNGFLVPPGNAEALADSIVRILHHPSLARKMGEAGFAMVKRIYTWDIQVEKTKKVIERVYKKRYL
jgi:glycosyltransferase involved in cell wall biosynthesis